MKKFLFLIAFCLMSLYLNAELLNPYPLNVLSGGGTEDESGFHTAFDSNSDIYYVGRFSDTVNFGSHELISKGNQDIFIVKTDSSGNYKWAISAGGINSDSPNSIDIDFEDNIYITGSFKEIAYFGSDSIESEGSQDVFIAKYDTNGNLKWVNKAGSTDSDYGKDLITDNNGYLYIIGDYQSNIDFGNSVELTATAYQEGFIAQYDSNGVCQWAYRIEGNIFDLSTMSAIEIIDNHLFVTGTFRGKADFDNGIMLNSDSGNDVFVAKYSNSGIIKWAEQFSSNSMTDFALSYDIAVDENADIYTCGLFTGDFIIDATTHSSNGEQDFYLMKIDSSGSVIWSKTFGGSGEDIALSIDVNDFLYVGGLFENSVDFGSDTTLISNGKADIFVSVFNYDGTLTGIYSAGSSERDLVTSLIADNENYGFLTGSFNGNISFGNSLNATSEGNNDAFFLKLNLVPVVISTIEYNLSEGWNYISAFVEPEEKNIDSIFKAINNDYLIIKNQFGELKIPEISLDNFDEFDNKDVYLVYANKNTSFEITGIELEPEEYTISLNQGWNYIPYLKNSNESIETVFNSIIDKIVIVSTSDGKVFIPNSFDTINNLETGEGYKIYLNEAVDFIYPEN